MSRLTHLEKFEKFCNRKGTEECWEWLGRLSYKGYGRITWYGKEETTNRVSWKIHKGPIPDGLHVLHKCDNPPCVNPNHLFLGTNDDNVKDKMEKGRHKSISGEEHYSKKFPEKLARGVNHGKRKHPESVRRHEEHPMAKLTFEKAEEIRRYYTENDVTQMNVADLFNVGRTTVQQVIYNKRW